MQKGNPNKKNSRTIQTFPQNSTNLSKVVFAIFFYQNVDFNWFSCLDLWMDKPKPIPWVVVCL